MEDGPSLPCRGSSTITGSSSSDDVLVMISLVDVYFRDIQGLFAVLLKICLLVRFAAKSDEEGTKHMDKTRAAPKVPVTGGRSLPPTFAGMEPTTLCGAPAVMVCLL